MRPVRGRLDCLGVGAVLLLGLAGCIAAPRIVDPVRPAIPPSKVRVFVSPSVPRHYTVIAKLDASGYGFCDSAGLDRIVLATLRKQAARLGADGVLISPVRHFHAFPTPMGLGGTPGTCTRHPPVSAKAIYFSRPRNQKEGRY